MLEIQGRGVRLCDGISRRSFLKIGSLGLAGLSLPQLLRAREAQPANRRRSRAVILYWMGGGPSHIDTYDMKPSAPEQVRGPFRPGATNIPGMQFNDLFTRQAPIADKISLIRSLAHTNHDHFDAAHWVQTGYDEVRVMGRGQPYPSQGSVVSMLRGPNQPGMPPYVCIPEAWSAARGFYQHAGFLGPAYNPLSSGGSALSERYAINRPELVLRPDMTLQRVEGRRHLQRQLQDAARTLETSGAVQAMDRYTQRAFELVTSPRAQAAFDLNREPMPIQERYGKNAWGQAALLARHALLSGGGVQGGRVVGATTSNGGEPRDRAVGPGDLLATIYHSLGIDPSATVTDRQNRPIRLVDHGQPIRELF